MTKLIPALLFTGMALVAAPITRVTLIDAGSPLVNDGAYFVGPYTLGVDGRNVPVLCTDLNDQSALGDQWNAYTTPLGGDLSDTYHPGAFLQYEEEAYLYTLLMEPGADRIGLQHAAWAITDEAYQIDQTAESWVSEARQNARKIDAGKFEIISEVDGIQGSRSQEFLTAIVPESSLVNLFAGLLAIGLALLGKKRG